MNLAGGSRLSEDEVSLFTTTRRREAGRIVLVGILTLLYWRSVLPFPLLLIAIAIGMYPLARAGLLDLWQERKIGTELFVTIATLIAVLGGEYVAASVLITIILIAEYIADLNTDRARASIKALVGATPRTATLRTPEGERVVPIEELTAGTLVDSGALDIRTDKVGPETLFAQIVALVEKAESEAAPVQKLTDRVAAWLLPLVLVFLIVVFVVTQDIRKIVALLIFTSPAELGLATPMVMVRRSPARRVTASWSKAACISNGWPRSTLSCSTRPEL